MNHRQNRQPEEDTGSDDEEAASQRLNRACRDEIVEPETAEFETEEAETRTGRNRTRISGRTFESEFDAALEESETENTTDEESGLTLSDVLEQAGNRILT